MNTTDVSRCKFRIRSISRNFSDILEFPRLLGKFPKSQVDSQIPKILGKFPSSGSDAAGAAAAGRPGTRVTEAQPVAKTSIEMQTKIQTTISTASY